MVWSVLTGSVAAAGQVSVGGHGIDLLQQVSLLGAVMQLAVFALMQVERLPTQSYPYQLANLVGSLLMTVVATVNREYGFILMEGVWCLTSAYGLLRLIAARGGA